MGIGFHEILLILLVVLLIFGAKRIPEIARALGKASFEFKKAREDIRHETDEMLKESEKHAAAEENAADASGDHGKKNV